MAILLTNYIMIILFPQPPEVWDGGVGFVSKEIIQTHCPAPAPDIKVYYLFPCILYLSMPELAKRFRYLASYYIMKTKCFKIKSTKKKL